MKMIAASLLLLPLCPCMVAAAVELSDSTVPIRTPVTIEPATIPADGTSFKVAGTLPEDTPEKGSIGAKIHVRGAGVSAKLQQAMQVSLLPGYAGPGRTWGAEIVSNGASTAAGINPEFNAYSSPLGNIGVHGLAASAASGYNFGACGSARRGRVNVGVWGKATSGENAEANVGVIGIAANDGTKTQAAGCFLLDDAVEPKLESAALIADNGGRPAPIFLARDAGTTVLQVADDGRLVVSRKLSLDRQETIVLAGGVIRATKSYHAVDTENAAASDDLVTIAGGAEGDRLVLRAVDADRTIVVRDAAGNIDTAGDFRLDGTADTLELIFDGARWLEINRSDNDG